ncbi:vesicle transport protein [Haematococcus lacustris]
MMQLWLNDQRKIGLGLTGFGILFTILGMLLMFDRGLIAMGNLLFLAGLATTIGIQSTVAFFLKRKNRKGSAFYLGGCTLVVVGWTVIGLLLEAFGFWLLFCEFIPTALQFVRRVPVLGKVLDFPLLKMIFNRIAPMGGLPSTNFPQPKTRV